MGPSTLAAHDDAAGGCIRRESELLVGVRAVRYYELVVRYYGTVGGIGYHGGPRGTKRAAGGGTGGAVVLAVPTGRYRRGGGSETSGQYR